MFSNWKRNTIIFLSAQMISLFGSALVQYAITWHITLVTQSGFAMTLAIICGFVPTFLLSPFAGVWADRYNRKTLVMVADGCIALTTLILALSILGGYDAIWPLFAALAIRACGAAVQTPCIGAILPSIVPSEYLTRVNGLNGSAQSAITLLSPMLSAILLKTTPFFAIFFIDCLTAALAISVMLFFFHLPKPVRAPDAERGGYWDGFKNGFSYVKRTPYLFSFFAFMAIFFVLFSPGAFLTPLQATRNYGADEIYLMAVEVAFSIGMIAGGILIAAWGGFRNRLHSMGLATFIMALCTFFLGLPLPFWAYMGLMGLYGLAMPLFNTPSMVMLQERVDPQYMGRVFSVMSMISGSLMPLGMLVFGPLADVISIEWLLLGTGSCMLLLNFFFMRDKHLLKAAKPER